MSIKRNTLLKGEFISMAKQGNIKDVIKAVQKRIGSKGELTVIQPRFLLDGKPFYHAMISDVDLALDRGETDYPASGGTLCGRGATEAKALEALLLNMLHPENAVSYERDKATLAVTRDNKSYTLFKIK